MLGNAPGTDGIGVRGQGPTNVGVYGIGGSVGVKGESANNYGVFGTGGYTGVFGQGPYGTYGSGNSAGAIGTSGSGYGLYGLGSIGCVGIGDGNGYGVWGYNADSGGYGVVGQGDIVVSMRREAMPAFTGPAATSAFGPTRAPPAD